MGRGGASTIAESFCSALDEQSVAYVVVRGCGLFEAETTTQLCVLVERDDLGRAARVAQRVGLSRRERRSGAGEEWALERDGCSPLRVHVTDTLSYGNGMRTAEPDRLLLGRRRRSDGVAVAATSDELIDLVLHCVLEARRFEPAHRTRLLQLMAALRGHPPDAGRAAIRVQTELAPALPWSDLLADVLHERWDELLSRRQRLVRRLRGRRPHGILSRITRALPGHFSGRRSASNGGRRGDSQTSSSTATQDAPAGSGAREAGAKRRPPREGGTAPAEEAEEGDSEGARHEPGSAAQVTRKQIRGSGLLLAGYGFSSGMRFVAELIVVRYLATEDYGAWTYALAAVAFLRGFAALGLNRAITRFLPQHLEERELSQFYGVLILVLASVVVAGTLVVTAFYTFPEQIASVAGAGAGASLALLFVLIFRVPLEVLDNVLLGVSAAFGDSRTIFVRRFLLHPVLRLGLAVVLVAMNADVILLAWGYLLAAVLGIGYYAWSVAQQMHQRGLLRRRLLRGLRLPVRRVLSYTAPVMASDWCTTFMITAGPLLLGYFTDLSTVALFQVVVPVAALNTLVFQSFAMLYEPSAARLVGRDDPEGLNEHYWRSALWVAVLTFPLFALSFTAAEPLTVALFGERYAAAAPVLSILALGRFIDSMAGFNAATLRVSGELRRLIRANIVGAIATVGVTVALIPPLGAVGAALGAVVGLAIFTVFKQLALRATSGVKAFDVGHAGPYLTIAAMTAMLVVVRLLWADVLWLVLPAFALASLAVLVSARVSLSVSETFPELVRWRLLRVILG